MHIHNYTINSYQYKCPLGIVKALFLRNARKGKILKLIEKKNIHLRVKCTCWHPEEEEEWRGRVILNINDNKIIAPLKLLYLFLFTEDFFPCLVIN